MASQESVDISQFTSLGETENGNQNENEGPMDGVTGTWADDTPVSHEEGVPVPDILRNLIDHGTRFKPVEQWSKTARPMLVKNLSVYFHVDTVVTSQAILEAFDAAGMEIDFITSIQWRASNRTWVVSFDNQLAKETALEVSSLEIGGTTVFLGDCENRLVLVKIFEAPAELPDTVVIGRLQHYGQVLSFRRDKIAQFIESGVRTARMRLHRHIPSVLNLAGEIVRVWYPNQPKSCRNCGSLDHLVRDCQSTCCFNCEKPGHRSEKCQEEPKCTCCKSEEHKLADCPYVKYSANMDNTPKIRRKRKSRKRRRNINSAWSGRRRSEKRLINNTPKCKWQRQPQGRKLKKGRLTKERTMERKETMAWMAVKIRTKEEINRRTMTGMARKDLEVMIGVGSVAWRKKRNGIDGITRRGRKREEESVSGTIGASGNFPAAITEGTVRLFVVVTITILMITMDGLRCRIGVAAMIINFILND